jgi:hypothetical protein
MSNLVVALDPGQRQDPAALCIVERITLPRDNPTDAERPRWDVAHAEQWALGTPHTAVVQDTLALLARPELKGARFLFDATGVGAVYEDLFRNAFRSGRLALQAQPIIMTAGVLDNGAHLAKRNLVGRYEAKLSSGQIAVREIPLRDEIAKQHQSFRAKFSQSGADTYEALREGRDHDDLIVVLLLATYWRVGAGVPRYLARDGRLYASREQSGDPY